MTRLIAPLVASVLLVPACVSGGAPTVCTAIAVREGLNVQVGVTGALLPDAYTIVVDADGQKPTLTLVVQPGDGGSENQVEAITAAGNHLQVEGSLSTTTGDVTIGYAEGGGPAQISLEIRSSKGVVAHADFTPSYHLYQPNGPDCPPQAHVAGATMTITP